MIRTKEPKAQQLRLSNMEHQASTAGLNNHMVDQVGLPNNMERKSHNMERPLRVTVHLRRDTPHKEDIPLKVSMDNMEDRRHSKASRVILNSHHNMAMEGILHKDSIPHKGPHKDHHKDHHKGNTCPMVHHPHHKDRDRLHREGSQVSTLARRHQRSIIQEISTPLDTHPADNKGFYITRYTNCESLAM